MLALAYLRREVVRSYSDCDLLSFLRNPFLLIRVYLLPFLSCYHYASDTFSLAHMELSASDQWRYSGL